MILNIRLLWVRLLPAFFIASTCSACCRIDVQEFTAGKSAPFPLLRPQPSHAAQHLLLDAHLALPAGAVGGVGHGKGGSKRDCSSSSGSGEVDSTKPYGGTQPVLSRIGDILEAALAAAGLPVQRRQFGAFPSFRRRPSQARQAAAEDGAGPDGKEHEGSGSEEEGGEAPPDMLYFACRRVDVLAAWLAAGFQGRCRLGTCACCWLSIHAGESTRLLTASSSDALDCRRTEITHPCGCSSPTAPPEPLPPCHRSRDGYATAIWYSDTATLSLDLLAASDAAVECMGDAAQELCEALVAEFPGSRMTGSSVARLPRQQQQQQ